MAPRATPSSLSLVRSRYQARSSLREQMATPRLHERAHPTVRGSRTSIVPNRQTERGLLEPGLDVQKRGLLCDLFIVVLTMQDNVCLVIDLEGFYVQGAFQPRELGYHSWQGDAGRQAFFQRVKYRDLCARDRKTVGSSAVRFTDRATNPTRPKTRPTLATSAAPCADSTGNSPESIAAW